MSSLGIKFQSARYVDITMTAFKFAIFGASKAMILILEKNLKSDKRSKVKSYSSSYF